MSMRIGMDAKLHDTRLAVVRAIVEAKASVDAPMNKALMLSDSDSSLPAHCTFLRLAIDSALKQLCELLLELRADSSLALSEHRLQEHATWFHADCAKLVATNFAVSPVCSQHVVRCLIDFHLLCAATSASAADRQTQS